MNLRAKFAWHLREPFAEEFDQTHWWDSEDKTLVTPTAALYELARRHPKIGQLRSKLRNTIWHGQELRKPLTGDTEKEMISAAYEDLGEEPRAVHCLCLIGLKSWPMLDGRNRDYWEASAGKIKGVDCRDAIECCRSITTMALGALTWSKIVPGKRTKNPSTNKAKSRSKAEEKEAQLSDETFFGKILTPILKKNPFTRNELEQEIARQAVEAYRAGHYLFSIVPDLKHDEARDLLSTEYAQEQKQRQQSKERARWNDWLPIIEKFEKDEELLEGAFAPVFTAYRRLFENLKFE